ncbi:MAG: ATP-binding protein [Solirubrobacterales bacterium]|nr:ATP-binding protein [Solirubrobacterales bacterium]
MRVERLVPGGLRWRLAAWVALVVVLSSAITFVAVYRGTATQLRRQIDKELAGDSSELEHAISAPGHRSPREVVEAADRYISGQPFSAGSTLLFAVIPGGGTATNRPELFTRGRPDNGETAAQQAHEDRSAQRLLGTRYGYSTFNLPDSGEVRLLKRSVVLSSGLPATVGVAEPLDSVSAAQSGVARAFILAAILTLAGALLSAYVIGTRFSAPLRRMAAVAARVDAGDLHPRIHGTGGASREMRVLAEAFNHMLDRLTEAFAAQRAFVADASHELRTPLTVVRGQLEVLAAQREPSAPEVQRVTDLVQSEVARIGRLVEDLLLLAKAEQGEFLRTQPLELEPFVAELWQGAKMLAERRFELGEVPSGTVQADPDRLTQALRNLLANAVEHTAEPGGLVRLSLDTPAAGRVRFAVEDDGPGIPAEHRELVFDRFQRTDRARDRASGGTGLGLAIVRAIAEAHGGTVRAGQARGGGGGARIELELPGFIPARPAPTGGGLVVGTPGAGAPAASPPVGAAHSRPPAGTRGGGGQG